MGLGYSKQPVKADISDKTGSRILDTVYHNTTGRPILCIVSLDCDRANGVNYYCFGQAKVENVTPPTDIVAYGGLYLADNVMEEIYAVITFAIPNEWYYLVKNNNDGISSVGIKKWVEVTL